MTRSACLFLLVVSAACGTATPAPLPSGPPPEYEPARGYQPPAGNIDTVATASAAATAGPSSAASSAAEPGAALHLGK